jgi:predicted transcriptional regulator
MHNMTGRSKNRGKQDDMPGPGWTAFSLLMVAAKDPLDNEVRRQIYEFVRLNPGSHLRAIARGLGLDTNQVKYHLVHLEQKGLVFDERICGHWVIFPREERDSMGGTMGRVHLFLLKRKVPQLVARKLLEVEEATHNEIQEAAGVSASTLYYHLRRLEENGVLVARKVRRHQCWRLRDPELCRRVLDEEPLVLTAGRSQEDAQGRTGLPWLSRMTAPSASDGGDRRC